MLTSTTNKVQYSISYPFGSTFPVTFKYWIGAEIHAKLSFPIATEKADQELVLNVDFSLTAPGDTGTLTRLSDWDHDAERLTIYRLLEIDQQTDYRNGEAVDMDLLEQDFDRAIARIQQVNERAERTLQGPITDEEYLSEIPEASVRALQFLGFDADGDTLVGQPVGVPATPWAQTLFDDANLLTGQKTLGLIPGGAGSVISAFVQNFLDDADLSAGQTTLGVSTYIKNLLDDADAPAARTTLGVTPFLPLLVSCIYGLYTGNDGTDPANDIVVGEGFCVTGPTLDVMTRNSSLIKRSDAAWAVGSGNGGMDAGTKPTNGWLYVFLIKRSDTGVVDALLSISATQPAMPTNYTLNRRIGAVRTDGSANILAFEQFGDQFRLKAFIADRVLGAVSDVSRQFVTLTVPPGMIARIMAFGRALAVGPLYAWVASIGLTNVAPDSGATSTMVLYDTANVHYEAEIPVDGSSQIAYRGSSTNVSLGINTLGWIDRRDKDGEI